MWGTQHTKHQKKQSAKKYLHTKWLYSTLLQKCLRFETSLLQNTPLTLITLAVVPKRHTLFKVIVWKNCAWLNMCQAVLNVEHFEGEWVWLSFNISKKMGRPRPLQVCTNVCIRFAHTGAEVIRVLNPQSTPPVMFDYRKFYFRWYSTLI